MFYIITLFIASIRFSIEKQMFALLRSHIFCGWPFTDRRTWSPSDRFFILAQNAMGRFF